MPVRARTTYRWPFRALDLGCGSEPYGALVVFTAGRATLYCECVLRLEYP